MNESIEKILVFCFGGIVGHLVNIFRNRIVFINYSIWHQSLGTSVQDAKVGTIQITYNNQLVESLYLSTIWLENNSNKDIKDLTFNIFGDKGSAIILSEASNESNNSNLRLTKEFMQLLEESKTDDIKAEQFLAHRSYTIPAFNRRDKVKILMLVSNKLKQQPVISMNCEHLGVRMKAAAAHQPFWGESQKYCGWIGSIVAIAFCWPLIKYTPPEFINLTVVASCLMGILALILGWLCIKSLKLLAKIIG